ncbi:hypothetical protein [Chryseobacterium sp. EO14]|uniref:hypothetical protein n=1 Tax=Chryseobacterium TaxID=59732 RepID=UPI00210E3603|nr:hypothetical protein [Chryseobacterium sp. EO14]MCQ4140099.1 hypothetical protein [Chryseobacterium sp. EO14]
MALEFKEEIIKIVTEKGLLSLVILIAGYWINQLLETSKQNNELKNKLHESSRDKILSNIEKQLSSFYYPVYFRIQKDNALWKLSPQLSQDSTFPMESNLTIENNFILKNHKEIVEIVENNIHLIEIDDELQEVINLYIKHVTGYFIIRSTESIKNKNPIDLGFPYPQNFEKIIKNRMTKLQKANNDILIKSLKKI